jgi:protein SCO1
MRLTGTRSPLLPVVALAGAIALGLLPRAATAQTLTGEPGKIAREPVPDEVLKKVQLHQKMDAQAPLDTVWRDETGKTVRLHEYFGKKPVMMMLIQFRCTMLCTEQMNILMENLRKLKFTPGREFTLLIMSIDPREQPELGAGKKKSYLEAYGRPEGAAGWHFLTGTQREIDRLSAAVGFRYAYDPIGDQYAHPDGVIILTPAGKVARYFFRLEYPARDLRFGLIEAAANKIGSPLDALALLCFHYNPATGQYSLGFMQVLRLAAISTVLILGIAILVMRLRERRKRPASPRLAPQGLS